MFNFNNEYKDIIGTIFLALSIIMLGYMLVSPFNQMIIHIDEYFTISVLNFPITDLAYVIAHDVHPPLYYLLLKIASDILTIFGIGFDKIFIYKIMTIIPYAIILILSVTKIKNEYGYFTAGLFAFSMAVMSEFLVYYSILRMYSWAALFVVLAFLYLRDVIDKNDRKYWALLTIFSVLAAYTHYFAAIPIVCIYICLFIYLLLNDKEKLKYWFISAICGIILFAPWIFSLTSQLTSVSEGYWIPEITFNNIIGFLGYFVTPTRNFYTCIFSVVIFVAIIVYTATIFNRIDKKDRFYILCGLIAYLGTIIIGTGVSIMVRPIMVDRYLLPSAAILWFAISFMIGKIEARKEFIIVFALVLIMMVAGISQLNSSNDYWGTVNMHREAFFDQISQDNDSIVINDGGNRMFYMEFSNKTDMYLLSDQYELYGYNLSELHDTFDFKEISKDELPKLVKENPDKNIYIICRNTDFDKHIKTTPVIDKGNPIILKVA
ncbi:hypothetical protein [Methanobrevibacter sp.]|uniref:glycosyltransferase family 39 protein n=1 Tax=Methanobrevibacter sp. TaxID=66852 RepID=UPI00388E6E36